MTFKKCNRPCKYRSSTPVLNGCDYMYLTGKRRGCEAGKKCTRFEKGSRPRVRVELTLPSNVAYSRSELIVRDYFEEQKKKIARVRDHKSKY